MKLYKITKKKRWRKKLRGLSIRWNDIFVRNMVLVLGAVFIRRGSWNLIDHYFMKDNRLASNIASIGIGIFLVFLLDGDIKDMTDDDDNDKKK